MLAKVSFAFGSPKARILKTLEPKARYEIWQTSWLKIWRTSWLSDERHDLLIYLLNQLFIKINIFSNQFLINQQNNQYARCLMWPCRAIFFSAAANRVTISIDYDSFCHTRHQPAFWIQAHLWLESEWDLYLIWPTYHPSLHRLAELQSRRVNEGCKTPHKVRYAPLSWNSKKING